MWEKHNSKKAECFLLAPSVEEILVGWGSAHKIATESGKTADKNA